MISVAHLCKSFGPSRALEDVSFAVERNEKVLLLGPNGAGKTTLLRILAGIIAPGDGAFSIAGHDPARRRQERARLVGYAGHQSMLYGDLSVGDNLRFFGRLYGLDAAAATARADRVLEMVDLAAQRDQQVKSLSQGQRQRIAIARSLVHDPEVLLLDEPFAGLDAAARAWLTDFLANTVTKTILFATHQPEADLPVARRAIHLVAGRLAADGPFVGPSAGPAPRPSTEPSP